MGIFKACDIRGVWGRDLTTGDAYRLGRAAARLTTRGAGTLVAGDVRLSTPVLKEALCRGLVDGGSRVRDAGTLTTPAFYFAVRRTDAALGVMVTASHNPAEYNGFKLLVDQRPVLPEELAALQKAMAGECPSPGTGSRRREPGWLDRYRSFVVNCFRRDGALKVVVDCGSGACSLVAPGAFRSLGYRTTPLYCDPDGRFLHRPPNPAVAENLAALCRRVTAQGAALGVAYDGDGDRVAFVDETGRPLDSDRVLALLARHLLARERGVVVYDTKCSQVVAEEVARCGGTPVMARSGHAFVGREFRERAALLAGELSGHFFWRDLGFDDGLFTSLALAEMIRESGLPLSELDRSLPRYPVTPDIRLPFAGDPAVLMEEVANRLSAYPLSRADGIRVDLGGAWGLIRPSITEPLVTMRCEGKTRDGLARVVDLMVGALPGDLGSRAAAAAAPWRNGVPGDGR